MQKQKKILITSILSLLLIVSFIRGIFFIEQVSDDSLQMDFTAYYTAGKVMNMGLNPYKNYIEKNWTLWDGVAQFNHSRFLYPPVAGNFFQILAKLPYASAKHIWNYLNLIFILLSIFLWLIISNYHKNIYIVLLSGILILNFFPVYTLLERGQIDGLIFLLISSGIFLIYKHRNKYLAGLLFATASVFKLYSLLLIPFLIIKKKYKAAAATLISLTAIIAIMYIVNGMDEVNDYIFNQTPRISQYGESGTDEMRPDSWILKNYFRISRYSVSMVEGRMYISESISFFSNASLVRLIVTGQSALGINIPAVIWSLCFLLPSFLFFYLKRNKYSKFNSWIIVLLLILLFSPFTWVMNLVWLMPVFFVLINLIKNDEYKNLAFILITAGLIIIYIPDSHRTYIKLLDAVIKLRHIAGELLILSGMIILPKFITVQAKTSA